MSQILIKNATLVNEGLIRSADVLIKNGIIEKIAPIIDCASDREIDAEGLHLLPGLIDDQVHFRQPGLTYKADIWHESRAAVAGGTTSFMEMPNTVPNTLSQDLLEEKYQIAATESLANYSFYMGAANDNLEQVLLTDPRTVCGVKVFMGSSTGNMLVDNETTLEHIFSEVPMLIATHCEDEETIRRNLEQYKSRGALSILQHPLIRSAEACYISSSKAVQLAEKYGTRLHILHISTEKETHLFRNDVPLNEKKITAEACIHHLWFTDEDYLSKGNLIKWNPAVKMPADREGVFKALQDGRIDVVATDHAPHTLAEKERSYEEAPSGGPLVQHALLALLDFYKDGKMSLEEIVQKTAHNTAVCFQIERRGFIREGYWADLVLVDTHTPYEVNRSNIRSKCGWSPFENHRFNSTIAYTMVSGNLVYEKGQLVEGTTGRRLQFERDPKN